VALLAVLLGSEGAGCLHASDEELRAAVAGEWLHGGLEWRFDEHRMPFGRERELLDADWEQWREVVATSPAGYDTPHFRNPLGQTMPGTGGYHMPSVIRQGFYTVRDDRLLIRWNHDYALGARRDGASVRLPPESSYGVSFEDGGMLLTSAVGERYAFSLNPNFYDLD
jgi:hypothetical protein